MASERRPHPNPQNLCVCHLTWKREISGEIELRILRWGLALLYYPRRPRWAEEGGRRLRGRVTQHERPERPLWGFEMEGSRGPRNVGSLQRLENARNGILPRIATYRSGVPREKELIGCIDTDTDG